MTAPTASAHPAPNAQGWQASVRLTFTGHADRTRLSRREQRGPLAIQRPFYPEGKTCHLYLLHPPGGVVGGDRLCIKADVKPGASALVTTPGATKFYRSAGAAARIEQRLAITGDGQLEWLPQENIFFPGAEVDWDTKVQLSGQGRFIGWEVNCLGRPTNEEAFDTGRIDSRLRIYRDGEALFCDRLQIDSRHPLRGPARLRGQAVVANLLASHVDAQLLAAIRETINQPADAWLGTTLLADLLVMRYLGSSTEQARRLFLAAWCLLRQPLLQRQPCPPRIWAT
jgi:urease accessory protein